MKKLLQINPVVKLNTSTGRIMKEIGELAIASGWESYIAYSKGRDGVPAHTSKLVPIGNKLDLLLHWLATRLFDAHGLASSRATRQFIRQIREIDPDLIHIHNVHGYFLNYRILFRYLASCGKPVVWTAHDCWLFTGHCYHYSAACCNKWKTGCGHCPQKHAFPTSWLLDRSRHNWRVKRDALTGPAHTTFVGVSDWMRGEMAQSFLAHQPLLTIHNGIDLKVFRPVLTDTVLAKYALEGKTVLLGIASIWLKEKGLEDLAKLAGMLEGNERLVLVGRMTDEQRKALPSTVKVIGRTSDVNELAALYTAATVLVNPTWQDNYPTVNLEAIACGTPVVTYRTGGSVESITERTGRIVEQGDVQGLLSAIREIESAGKQAFLGPCREYALAHFSKEDRYKDYIQLYENLTTR